MHTPQVHEPPSILFCFKPTAAQSNALISGAGGGIGFGAGLTSSFAGAAPGRGASQTVHFSVAEAAFCNMHVPHVQSPPDAAVACFIPAAAQSNALGADEEGVDEGKAKPPLVLGMEEDEEEEEATGTGLKKSYAGIFDIGVAAATLRASRKSLGGALNLNT